MRFSKVLAASVWLLGVAACGDGGGGDDAPDAAPATCKQAGGAACFEAPLKAMTVEVGGVEQAANLSCAKHTVTTSTAEISVSGEVTDLQTGDPVSGAELAAFYSLDFSAVKATATSDASGNFSVALPAGAPSRMIWRIKHVDALDTYAMNDPLDVSGAPVTGMGRESVSLLTANALPAFIGVTRTEGLGVLAGTVEDCDGREVLHAIANISSTPSAGGAAPTFVSGAQVYYFSNQDPDLPVARTVTKETKGDGMFVVIEIPPTSAGQKVYLQTWGFTAAADVGDKTKLKLIAEYEAIVIGDSVISLTMSPTQGPL